jgi:pimeloyl-ACP methyl ester carboxylesterase
VLKSAFENDYPNLKEYYKELANLSCPALIIWGRQDQVCVYHDAFFKQEILLFDSYAHLKVLIISSS